MREHDIHEVARVWTGHPLPLGFHGNCTPASFIST
jgi:hypothetical protein